MDEYAIQEKNKLKAIDYDIQWAAREKENILTAGRDYKRKTDEKMDKKVISQTTVILFCCGKMCIRDRCSADIY